MLQDICLTKTLVIRKHKNTLSVNKKKNPNTPKEKGTKDIHGNI